MSEFVVFFPVKSNTAPRGCLRCQMGFKWQGQPRVRSQLRLFLSFSLSGTESRPVKWACSTVRMRYPQLDHIYDRRLDDARRWSLAIHECAKKVIECNGVKEVVVLRGNEEADGE